MHWFYIAFKHGVSHKRTLVWVEAKNLDLATQKILACCPWCNLETLTVVRTDSECGPEKCDVMLGKNYTII